MSREPDVVLPADADPVIGLDFVRLTIDVRPPCAATVVFHRVRQSGAVAGEVAITLGDALPEEAFAKMIQGKGVSQKLVDAIRAADQRGERASKFLRRVLAPNFKAEIIAELREGGELAAASLPNPL